MKKIAQLLMLLMLLAASASALTDPFVGKWILNVQRSNYPAGACPMRMIIEMNAVGEGIHYRSDTTYKNGASTKAEYTAKYDGRQAIVVGTHGILLPVSLKRIDSHTVLASYTNAKSLEVIARSRRVVSKDGKLMTITTTAKSSSGKNVTTTGVYEKAAGGS